jgi:hypothetical protein
MIKDDEMGEFFQEAKEKERNLGRREQLLRKKCEMKKLGK